MSKEFQVKIKPHVLTDCSIVFDVIVGSWEIPAINYDRAVECKEAIEEAIKKATGEK